MEIRVRPTEKIEKLQEDLNRRCINAKIKGGEVVIQAENPEFLEKVPGVKEYSFDDEVKEGLKGRPLHEQAYIRIESREDAVKALLATMDGYNLVVLDSEREWDLRKLREYNPDIKHLDHDRPKKILDIDRAVGEIEDLEQVEIEVSDEEIELVYREMLA